MSMLEDAARVSDAIDGERNADYGHPLQNFATIAALWSAAFGREFSREDVALAMILLKVARLCGPQQTHRDSWVDIAGYVNCIDAIHEANGAPKTMEELTRQYMREHQAERQEQVRERHDIVQTALDARTTTDTPCCWTHAADWQRQLFIVCSVCGNKRCPRATDCTLDCTGSNELGQAGSRFAWEPPDSSAQRPPDRHSAAHCPDGGACKHKCGLEPCRAQS